MNVMNFAIGFLATKPNATATTFTLETGTVGNVVTDFPAYAVIWDFIEASDASFAKLQNKTEVVKMTANPSGDDITVERAQLGTTAIDFTGGGTVAIGQAFLDEHWIRRLAFETKTGTYTAKRGDAINADTSAGSWTLTMPASPKDGDVIPIADVDGNWKTNNLTLAGNGTDNIEGASTFTCDVSGYLCYVTWSENDNEWKVL